jgi:hypothetical protein
MKTEEEEENKWKEKDNNTNLLFLCHLHAYLVQRNLIPKF